MKQTAHIPNLPTHLRVVNQVNRLDLPATKPLCLSLVCDEAFQNTFIIPAKQRLADRGFTATDTTLIREALTLYCRMILEGSYLKLPKPDAKATRKGTGRDKGRWPEFTGALIPATLKYKDMVDALKPVTHEYIPGDLIAIPFPSESMAVMLDLILARVNYGHHKPIYDHSPSLDTRKQFPSSGCVFFDKTVTAALEFCIAELGRLPATPTNKSVYLKRDLLSYHEEPHKYNRALVHTFTETTLRLTERLIAALRDTFGIDYTGQPANALRVALKAFAVLGLPGRITED